MHRLIVFQGCRSDIGLSDPIVKRLKNQDWCSVKVVPLVPQEFITSYQISEYHCKAENHIGNSQRKKPSAVLVTGDRVEMTAAAAAAFHNDIPIIHLYAGVVNTPVTTYDDINRHAISLWSSLQLCESVAAQWVVWDLKKAVRLPVNSVNVGITMLDDMVIDESKVPEELENDIDDFHQVIPYDLILYNTPTKTDYSKDIAQIRELISDSYSVLVSGNPDGDAESALCEWVDEYHIDLTRAQFLGLLKNCTRFISNSSCTTYEAPYFLKEDQIIRIGDRNKNRTPVICAPGGSDKCVAAIREFLYNCKDGVP